MEDKNFSEEDLLIDTGDELEQAFAEEEESPSPQQQVGETLLRAGSDDDKTGANILFGMTCFMTRESENELGFDFKLNVPSDDVTFKDIDWLVFLALVKLHSVNVYEAALQEAIMSYLDLREDSDPQEARADIEEYLREVTRNYFEEE